MGIRSKLLTEHQYREGCARSLERKKVEWDGESNAKDMWGHVKRAVFETVREVCSSVRAKEKNPKTVLLNDEIQLAVERKKVAWKEVLEARDEAAK